MNDLLERLAALPAATPSKGRGNRTRTRARTSLALQSPPAAAGMRDERLGPRPLWLVAGAGISVVYVAEVLVLAATVLGARFRG